MVKASSSDIEWQSYGELDYGASHDLSLGIEEWCMLKGHLQQVGLDRLWCWSSHQRSCSRLCSGERTRCVATSPGRGEQGAEFEECSLSPVRETNYPDSR
jgi:hypothetical protein